MCRRRIQLAADELNVHLAAELPLQIGVDAASSEAARRGAVVVVGLIAIST
jgi:hypothetical protein